MTISIKVPITAAQVAQILAAGAGCTVHHPHARSRAGRAEIRRLLTRAGLSSRIAATLAWSSTGDPAPALHSEHGEQDQRETASTPREPDPDDRDGDHGHDPAV
jgi:uncharacterized protein (DUF849 family)